MGNKHNSRASELKDALDFSYSLEKRDEEEVNKPKNFFSRSKSKESAFSKSVALNSNKALNTFDSNVISQYSRLHPFALKQLKLWKERNPEEFKKIPDFIKQLPLPTKKQEQNSSRKSHSRKDSSNSAARF